MPHQPPINRDPQLLIYLTNLPQHRTTAILPVGVVPTQTKRVRKKAGDKRSNYEYQCRNENHLRCLMFKLFKRKCISCISSSDKVCVMKCKQFSFCIKLVWKTGKFLIDLQLWRNFFNSIEKLHKSKESNLKWV